jgi:hypothetical protein
MKASQILLSAAIAAALFVGIFLDEPLRPILRETPLGDIRYSVSLVVNLIGLALLAAVILLFGGQEARDLGRLSGISAPIGGPLLFAFAIFAPAVAVAAFIAKPVAQVDAVELLMLSLVFPIIEEIGFRGLAVGALMRIAGWRFLPAALLPAAVFGAAHAGQGESLAEIGGVVAITGIGGLLLGWLFVRWGFNLWPAIFAHVGLNALWGVYDLGENAIGGWTGNALRLGVIAAAILYTLFVTPRMARRAAADA